MALRYVPTLLHPTSVTTTGVLAFVTGQAGAKTLIQKAVFSNFGTAIASVTAWLVPSGGGATNANVIIPIRAIPPQSTDLAPELVNLTLNPGDTIQITCDTATTVNFTASGLVIIQ